MSRPSTFPPVSSIALAVLLGCTTTAPVTGETPETSPHTRNSRALTQALVDAVARWHSSCSTPVLDGLCLQPRAQPDTEGCRPTFVGRYQFGTRATDAASAQAELGGLLADAYTEIGDSPEQDDALRAAIADAELARMDAELEQFAALRFDQPDPEAQARAVTDKLARGRALVTRLAAIKDIDDPPGILRAALRTAWVNLLLADEISGSPAPAHVERTAYCAALGVYDLELVAHARDAVSYCVERADDMGIASPTVDICRDLAGRIAAAGPDRAR